MEPQRGWLVRSYLLSVALVAVAACRFDSSGLPRDTMPDGPRRDVSRLDARLPDAPPPDGRRLDSAAPREWRLDAPTRDVARPDRAGPDTMPPDLAQPDVMQPDVMQPDVMQPDVMQPDVMQPDVMEFCSSIFGQAAGFILCSSETAANCKFYSAATSATSCSYVCGQFSASCAGVRNNQTVGDCAPGTGSYTCASSLSSKICECQRP
jgi:hypothetical protein